jgi:XTP/dITP diphosphohydrolase
MESEEDLGKLLLAIVASARSLGLDAERALREATRELQAEIRAKELEEDFDAGVVGVGN